MNGWLRRIALALTQQGRLSPTKQSLVTIAVNSANQDIAAGASAPTWARYIEVFIDSNDTDSRPTRVAFGESTASAGRWVIPGVPALFPITPYEGDATVHVRSAGSSFNVDVTYLAE